MAHRTDGKNTNSFFSASGAMPKRVGYTSV